MATTPAQWEIENNRFYDILIDFGKFMNEDHLVGGRQNVRTLKFSSLVLFFFSHLINQKYFVSFEFEKTKLFQFVFRFSEVWDLIEVSSRPKIN